MKNLSVRFFVSYFLVSVFGLQLSLAGELATRPAARLSLCEKVALEARSGDLVFIAIDSFVFKQIAKDTLTWTSHVGIIFKEKGEWVVYESRIPRSTVTPLCDYVKRGMDEMVEIKRFNHPLSKATLRTLKSGATDRLGYYYHTGFDYDNDNRMFCSKYVYDIFLEADIEVGRIETLEELFNRNPDVDLNFWSRWYMGHIPWGRRTVTPGSQVEDEKFTTVFSNNIKTRNSQSLQ